MRMVAARAFAARYARTREAATENLAKNWGVAPRYAHAREAPACF
jgi:hypothetical protein